MTATRNNIYDYRSDLDAATSAADSIAVTLKHVSELGFRNVVLAYTQRPKRIDGDLPRYLRYSTVSKNWENRYREMRYQNHCPLYRESLRSGQLPFIWKDVLARIDMAPMQRQAEAEAAAAGLSEGISVPIKEPNGDRCAIGISTDIPKAKAAPLVEERLPLIFLMSHHLHAVMVDRYVNQGMRETAARLTLSEQDCLQWVAEGKANWEISEIHGISQNTVKYHMRNVMKKLSVSTRAAAVAKAVQLGLIEL